MNIFAVAALIAVIGFAPFMMKRSFAAQNASNFTVTPKEVTIFAAREASSGVTSGDAQTMRLTISVFPAGEGLTWKSDNKNSVTVNTSGDITSVKQGGANITATHTASGSQAACKVKVVPAPTTNWADAADISWHNKNKTTFTITTAQQLAGIAVLVNAGSDDFTGDTITLTNDIDLSAREWTAIGTDAKLFKGAFDGGGHAITGLYINKTGPQDKNQGLFGCIDAAGAIKDLRLSGCVAGGFSVGGVASDNVGAVTNCAMTGSVKGSSQVGGVVGRNASGTVSNCATTGSVTGSGNIVGGVVGFNDDFGTVVRNCAMTGGVTGSGNIVGGVVAWNYLGTVSNSAMTGSVTGSSEVGGVVGISVGTVSNSAMTGSVTGSSKVGGVIGSNVGGFMPTNCGWLASAANDGIGEPKRPASVQVTSFDAANIPVTTILFDDYDLMAAVNTSSDMTVRTYPGASAALKAVVFPDIAKIENFAISGDVTAACVTGATIGSADVMVSAIVARGAKNYKAQMQARLTVLPEPPKPAPPKPDPPQPDPAPAPAPDPKPTPESGSSGGCSAGAGGIAMLVLAAAAMLGRKGKR
ncbi:MAG: GLUG motif-containing protein [Cloacibacillus sp.]